jgi:hypothetical protein
MTRLDQYEPKTYGLPVGEAGLTRYHLDLAAHISRKDPHLAGKLLAYWQLQRGRYELSPGETRRLVVHSQDFPHERYGPDGEPLS